MKPYISVIVPVYGVEDFLPQCIDSILAQTYEDFELILVDDGSPDGCPSICDSYESRNPRIRVIHKTNGGLVSARQEGLKISAGEYIVNVDGDDWIGPDLLEHISRIAKRYQPDLITYDYSREFSRESIVYEEPLDEGYYDRKMIERWVYPKILMDENMSHVHCNLCGKAIRRDLLWKYQMAVDPRISWGEDLLCTVPMYMEVQSMFVLRKALYFYRARPQSMTKNVRSFLSGREIMVIKSLEQIQGNKIPEFGAQLDRYALAVCCWMMIEIAAQGVYDVLDGFQKYVKDPVFQRHVRRANFCGLTPKMRITVAFLRRCRIKEAYWFLRLCHKIKNRKKCPSGEKSLRIAMLGHKRVPSREGGIEVVVGELSSRMAEKGHRVTCYNRGGHHVSGREFESGKCREWKGVKLRSVFTIDYRGWAAMSASATAAFLAAVGPYDVVHFHAEGPCAMIWLPKLFRKRCIATIHGLDHKRAKWGRIARLYILAGERMAVKFADEIIVLSKDAEKYFMETYHRRTRLIPNGIQRPAVRTIHCIKEQFGLSAREYILFVGRLVPEKGIDCLIDAYKQVKTDKRLVIAGGSSDTQEYVRHLKQKAKKDPRVLFTGFVQGPVLEELYSNASFYVQPSDLEGMPLTLLEAMSYGNCCLVSDLPECADVVQQYGIVFERGNTIELAKKMQELCSHEELTEKYRQQSADFICGKYNWDRIVEQTLEVYKEGKKK